MNMNINLELLLQLNENSARSQGCNSHQHSTAEAAYSSGTKVPRYFTALIINVVLLICTVAYSGPRTSAGQGT